MPAAILVILIIAALIYLIAISRIKVYAYYADEIEFSVRYLLFKFRINKPQPGQANKGKKVKQEKKKINKPSKNITLDQVKSFINIYAKFWDDTRDLLLKMKKKSRIDNLYLDLTIGGDDAAETAITYGAACAVVYPTISAVERIIKIKKKKIMVNAEFNGANKIIFDVTASISIGALIKTGARSSVKIIMALIKNPIKLGQRGIQNE